MSGNQNSHGKEGEIDRTGIFKLGAAVVQKEAGN
jgi:hypothetical protein